MSVYWNIRVYGKIVLGLEFIHQQIQHITYVDKDLFVHDIQHLETALAIYIVDEDFEYSENNQVINALREAHLNTGLPWGVVVPLAVKPSEEMYWLRELGCIFAIPSNARARIFYGVKNWFQVDCYAERALLGRPVRGLMHRNAVKAIHKSLSEQFIRRRKANTFDNNESSRPMPSLEEVVLKNLNRYGLDKSFVQSLALTYGFATFESMIAHCWKTVKDYNLIASS